MENTMELLMSLPKFKRGSHSFSLKTKPKSCNNSLRCLLSVHKLQPHHHLSTTRPFLQVIPNSFSLKE